MDFRKLISTLEHIEKKQILKEGKDWDKDGKVEKPSQEYRGVKDNAIKKAMSNKHKKESIDSTVSIAQYLLREFDLEEKITLPSNPWTNDPEKSAAWEKLSLKDKQWLGKADPTDPYILMRAPDKGKPVEQPTTDPTAGVQGSTAATAAQPDGPDGSNASAIDADATDMSMGAAGAANAAAAPAAVSSPVASTPEPETNSLPDPAKVKRFKELLAKASGTATPSSAATKPTPSKAELSGPASGQYTIKKGDNLTKIAKANGTSIQAILAANPQIKNPNMIYAGAKLNLPAAPAASGSPAINPIKNTDSNTLGQGGLDTSTSMVAP